MFDRDLTHWYRDLFFAPVTPDSHPGEWATPTTRPRPAATDRLPSSRQTARADRTRRTPERADLA